MYLAPDGTSTEYGSILVEINKRIKRDLALSANLTSLYAMTQDKVGRGALEEGVRGSLGATPSHVWPLPGLGLQRCVCSEQRQGP